jgi:ribosomal protein L11 methyltransferase
MDYGCGSGILAVEPPCFTVQVKRMQWTLIPLPPSRQKRNARDNGVGAKIRVGLPDISSGPYDTVFANILATPLKVLAPLLCGLVKPGGHLVLAGILQRQEEELKAAYAPYCELQVSRESEGWILMTAQMKTVGT